MVLQRDLFRYLNNSQLKSICEKQGKQMLSLKHKLANFLLMYCSTPHSVTGKTPSELFLKRHIRTRFSLLKPDLAKSVHEKQQEQKKQHDRGRQVLRAFVEEKQVGVRNFRGGQEKWLSPTMIEWKGPVLSQRVREDALCMWTIWCQEMLQRDPHAWCVMDPEFNCN